MGKMDNLKNFEKGKSGNPKGRPKGAKNRSTALKKLLSIKTTFEVPGSDSGDIMKGNIEDRIAAEQIRKALKGDLMAFKEIMDSVYGKTPFEPEPSNEPKKGASVQGSLTFTIVDPVNNETKNLDLGGAYE